MNMLTLSQTPILRVLVFPSERQEGMTISMSKVNCIRQMRREGGSISSIAESLDVSRDTVYKYTRKDDFSPAMPVDGPTKPSKLDPYKPIIGQWLDDDERSWHKQRHTARRIWQRLRDEFSADVSETTVSRYVKEERHRRRGPREQFLDLVWAPGEAQADFGEADFYLRGVRTRLSFFVLTFPYSNVGLAQVLPGQNAECVCEGLRRIFGHVGGVPRRIVFDNATGVGRRVGDAVRTTKLFGAFSAHYDFGFTFCNPDAGHEKGNVENKVGTIRRDLMVPVAQVFDMAAYNTRLLERCLELAGKPHYRKGEPEIQLFVEDRFAMAGLPDKPFEAVRYERPKADKQGKVHLDGPHLYSTSPSLAGSELVAALGATTVRIYDARGTFVCEHSRSYGKTPTDTTDPASQLALLCLRSGAWKNSQVRASLSDGLREHMDSLGADGLRAELRMMRDEAAQSGWSATLQAAEMAYSATSRLDAASVAVGAARLASGRIDYDEPVDLGVYDAALGMCR